MNKWEKRDTSLAAYIDAHENDDEWRSRMWAEMLDWWKDEVGEDDADYLEWKRDVERENEAGPPQDEKDFM